MWTRSLLKTNAKSALAANYWRAFLVCLVAALFGAGSRGLGSGASYKYESSSSSSYGNYFGGIQSIFVLVMILIGVAIAIAITAFVCNIIEIGYDRYFMEARVGNAPFSSLFSAFSQPYYMNEVKTLLLRDIYVFLWSLLFVIPGIIKYYEYRMVPYIVSENPGIESARAFELSRQMTNGEKWNIFVLDLSFIGWYILCGITFGIGFLFLSPYVQATNAELYSAMRAKAFAEGYTDETELGDFVRY